MVGASFYRSEDAKCPKCGTFGKKADDEIEDMVEQDSRICPHCETVFNNYIIFEHGEDVEFRNN